MTPSSPSQVTLLPAQLGRLAKLFPEGGAVAISQNGGSVISATNGIKSVKLNAQGDPLDENPDQETLSL